MLSNVTNQYEICYQAWLRVKKWCGGITEYAELTGLARSTVSDWFNTPGIEIPFEYLALTELMTDVIIECLCPFNPKRNNLMRYWQTHPQASVVAQTEQPIFSCLKNMRNNPLHQNFFSLNQ